MSRAGRTLHPGDQVRFDDAVWTVTAVGSSIRLADDAGRTELVLLAALLSSPGFELLATAAEAPRAQLEPVSLLEALPAEVVARARDWERHVLEAETGLAPGTAAPRPGFDPAVTTVEQRDQAKAAELTAAGQPTGARTVKRMRGRYRSSGLWGLIDQRRTRPASPHGRVDERVVAATRGDRRRSTALDRDEDAAAPRRRAGPGRRTR